MFTRLALAASTAAILTVPAYAGNMTAPQAEPEVMAPAPAPAMRTTPDWTGGYVGAQLGYADVDTNAGVDGDDIIGGFVAGYDYDFGDWVVGAGIDYDFADIDLDGAASVENVLRLKLRGGYDLGNNGLIYATGGYAEADTDTLGDDDGYFIGAGYEHMVSDTFSVGGELLYHEFDNFNGTAIDVDATTLQVRGTYRF